MTDNDGIITCGYEIKASKITRTLSKAGKIINLESVLDGNQLRFHFNEHHGESTSEIASLNTEIASIQKAIEEQKNTLKEKKTALKKTEKEVASQEAKKAKADAKAAEEAKKTEAEAVLKKLLASGMSADEILEKLK